MCDRYRCNEVGRASIDLSTDFIEYGRSARFRRQRYAVTFRDVNIIDLDRHWAHAVSIRNYSTEGYPITHETPPAAHDI